MKASLCLIRGEMVSPHFRRIRGKLKRKEHGPRFWRWNAECSPEWKGNDSPDLETTLICHEKSLVSRLSKDSGGQRLGLWWVDSMGPAGRENAGCAWGLPKEVGC